MEQMAGVSARRAAKEALTKIQDLLSRSAKGRDKLLSGDSKPGDRLAPARNAKNDAAVGARLDNGMVYTRDGQLVKRIYFQPNKNANDKSLKKAADENSHQNLSWAEIPVKKDADDKEKAQLVGQAFEDLINNLS